MAITNAQRDKAWIDMINGKRKTAGGKIIRTKADLLEVKQYLPMVSQAVKDAYNKRMASFRDSADSVKAIAAKYGVSQNDAAGDSLQNLRTLIANGNKKLAAARTMRGDAQAKIKARNELTSLMSALTTARFAVKKEADSATGAAYSLVNEIDKFVSNFK